MPMTPSARVAFLALLTKSSLAYTDDARGLIVEGNVKITRHATSALPDHMTVRGDLLIASSRISRLPAGLRVLGNLHMGSTDCTHLPQDMYVQGSILAEDSQISRLPTVLHVPGSLKLAGTRVRSLPEELTVGGDLSLRATEVVRLPEKLSVGGLILPPSGLIDIRNFMKTQKPGTQGAVVVYRPTSAHHLLALRVQWHAFPDLWRAVGSLPPGRQPNIFSLGRAGYRPSVQKSHDP